MTNGEYRHTQTGWLILGALGVGAAFMAPLLLLRARGAAPLTALVLAILGGAGAVFSRLTIEVGAGELRASFGLGWTPVRTALSEIEDVRVVENPFWYGWGIHWTPRGWLYNVSGRGGVEVRLRTGKRFRLGTDEPERLRLAILNNRDGARPPG